MRKSKKICRFLLMLTMLAGLESIAQEAGFRMSLTGGVSSDNVAGKLSVDFGNSKGFIQANTLLLFSNEESNSSFDVRYDLYSFNLGYYPLLYKTLHNRFRLYMGLGGSLGFENIVDNSIEGLSDQNLEVEASVITGTFAGIDIEAQLIDQLTVTSQGTVMYYYNGSNLKNILFYAGIGLRYYFPHAKREEG